MSARVARAVILAAGRGSRLGPATVDRPKVLVEVAGASILQHQRRTLAAAGIAEVHLVAGHALDLVRGHPDLHGLRLHVNGRWSETNMVATLACAEEVLDGSTDLVIAYGDIVYEPRLLTALAGVADADVGVVVDLDWERYWRARMDDPLADAETLRLDDEGRLLEIGAPATGYEDVQGQYVGLLRIRADRIAALIGRWRTLGEDGRVRGRDRDSLYMTDLLQLVIGEGWDVRAAPVQSGWLEFDTPADLALDPGPFWAPEVVG